MEVMVVVVAAGRTRPAEVEATSCPTENIKGWERERDQGKVESELVELVKVG